MATIRRLGFTSLSPGQAEARNLETGGPVFNIVFVHGLRGHPQHTWESEVPRNDNVGTGKSRLLFLRRLKGKAKPTEGEESVASQSQEQDQIPVHWPSRFLVADLPQAHVWTYGYNADVIGGLFQANNKNSISQHGRDLANQLERDIENDHPIIFVVHSLGGIVVKDAMYESNTCQQRTKLIVFLGTPHRESDAAEWGKIAANLAQVGFQDSNKQILRSLEVNSEILDRIHRDFVAIVHEKKIKIHSFQESRPLTGIKGFDGKVVSDFSSRFDLPKDLETVETIDADHVRITKYGTREDPGYCAVKGVIKKFCREYASNQSLVNPVSSMDIHQEGPALFVVPFSRNEQFVGRKGVISKLFAKLSPSPDYHKRLAIAGLGGVGKTQIALEFIHEYQKRFPQTAVYWVYASNKQQFENSYSTIARLAELSGRDDASRSKLSLVADWLSRQDTPPWLIVVDNADDGDLFFNENTSNNQQLSFFLPQRRGCSILVTTRDGSAGHNLTNKEPIEIQAMKVHEAMDLLHEQLPQRLRHGMSEALVESLESLPLAISQAAAFMLQNRLDIPGYMDLLETESGLLLSEEFKDLRRYVDNSNAVFITWMVTFDQIREKNPSAADTLIRMSFYDRQSIPESLLCEESESRLEFLRKTSYLISFSLIRCTQDRKTYGMHRLVREATRNWVRKQTKTDDWETSAMVSLRKELPAPFVDNRYNCMVFIPHATILLGEHGPEFGHDLAVSAPSLATERAYLLYWAAHCIDCFGGSQSFAIKMLTESLAINDTLVGMSHGNSTMTLSLYIEMAYNQPPERLPTDKEEKDILQRLYRMREQAADVVIRSRIRFDIMVILSHRDMDGIEEVQNMANLNIEELRSQGGADMGSLYVIGSTYGVLGMLYRKRAEWKAAEVNLRQEVSVAAEILGPDSQQVWIGRSWIIDCLWRSGNLMKAEGLARQMVKAMVRKWRTEDREVIREVRLLNYMLEDLGKPLETLEIMSKGDPAQTWESVDSSM